MLSALAADLHYISIQTSKTLALFSGLFPSSRLVPGESRVGSWTTVLTQVTGVWWPSYPLGGFYKNSQVLIFLCSSACSMNISLSPVPGSPGMSTACCWMPGLPRHACAFLLLLDLLSADHSCFCSSDTSASLYKALRPLTSENRLSRCQVISRCLKKQLMHCTDCF